MTKQELYLKTIFCCMACDGEIANEEVAMVKETATDTFLFNGVNTEVLLNNYISAINTSGQAFLRKYFSELAEVELTPEDELTIVDLAIKTIEADSRIEYAEVKFFKKIRKRLSVSDELILEKHPDKEDFLLPDINEAEFEWNDVLFNNINLRLNEL